MVELKSLAGKRVYVDTNVVIYSAEGFVPYATTLKSFFQSMEAGSFQGVTSEVTLMEALVRPIRQANAQLAAWPQQFIGNLPREP